MSESKRADSTSDTPGTNPETWVDEYGDYLYRYALMRVRNSAQAEDLVQETLLAGLQARSNFAGQSTEKTWLVGILKHKIIDFFRKNRREKVVDTASNNDFEADDIFDKQDAWAGDSAPVEWPNPTQALENQEFKMALMECLSAIPPRTAEAFTLREMEELSSEEVCGILKITPNNFWVMMHRARLALRQCLELKWLKPHR